MHTLSPLPRTADDTLITTVDGVRFRLDDDPARTVVTRLPDGSAVRMPLGEFLQQRSLAAQTLRRAELERCLASAVRGLRLLDSTLRWPVRAARRALAPQRA